MLIDNAHSVLCLDGAKVMRQEVKGEHIALVTPAQPEDEALFTVPLTSFGVTISVIAVVRSRPEDWPCPLITMLQVPGGVAFSEIS